MRRNGKRIVRVLFLAGLLLLAFGMTAQAANGWVRKKNKWYYYVNNTAVKGLTAIGGHLYYFDEAGVQRTSWRQIDSDFYCFRSEEQSGGYLLTNTARNGIALGADGKADLSSERAIKKAGIMVRVSALMDRVIDRNKKRLATRRSKLKACYDFLRKKYPYRFVSHFRETDPDYDLWYVDALLVRGYSDCHPYACTFAYLANAVGYTDVTICSYHSKKYGGIAHSWVKIGTKIYDVSLGRFNKKSYALFGIKPKKYFKKYPIYKVKNTKHLWEL